MGFSGTKLVALLSTRSTMVGHSGGRCARDDVHGRCGAGQGRVIGEVLLGKWYGQGVQCYTQGERMIVSSNCDAWLGRRE